MADWFTQNAPKSPPVPVSTGGSDWFAANAPSASAIPGMEKLGAAAPSYPAPPDNKARMEQIIQRHPETAPEYDPTFKQDYGIMTTPMAGVHHVVRGVERMAEPGGREKAGATHDIAMGAAQASIPFVAASGITAPLKTAGAVAGAMGAQKLVSGTAKVAGVPPEYADVAGDMAAIPGGILGSKAAGAIGAAPGMVANYMDRVDPKSAMIKGIKPAANRLGFDKAVDRAMPELKASESQLGKPVASVDDALAATKLAKQRVWASYKQLSGGSDMVIDTHSLSQKLAATDPDAALAVSALGRKYGQTMGEAGTPASAGSTTGTTNVTSRVIPLDKAEALLKQKNNELDAFYAKYPTAQRTAAGAHPEIASAAAEANALRDAIYNTLDSDSGGSGPRAIKQKYGALIEIEKGLERRRNVAARQQPDSLSEQVGAWSGMGDVAKGVMRLGTNPVAGVADIASGVAKRQISKMLKESQTTDNLIRRAFKYYQGDMSRASPQVPNTPEVSTTSPFAPNAPQPPVSVAGARNRTMTPPQSIPPVMSVGGTNARQMLPLKRLDQ